MPIFLVDHFVHCSVQKKNVNFNVIIIFNVLIIFLPKRKMFSLFELTSVTPCFVCSSPQTSEDLNHFEYASWTFIIIYIIDIWCSACFYRFFSFLACSPNMSKYKTHVYHMFQLNQTFIFLHHSEISSKNEQRNVHISIMKVKGVSYKIARAKGHRKKMCSTVTFFSHHQLVR